MILLIMAAMNATLSLHVDQLMFIHEFHIAEI